MTRLTFSPTRLMYLVLRCRGRRILGSSERGDWEEKYRRKRAENGNRQWGVYILHVQCVTDKYVVSNLHWVVKGIVHTKFKSSHHLKDLFSFIIKKFLIICSPSCHPRCCSFFSRKEITFFEEKFQEFSPCSGLQWRPNGWSSKLQL